MWLRLEQKQVDFRLRIFTVPGAQEEARRNGVEMEKNKDKSNSCDVSVISRIWKKIYQTWSRLSTGQRTHLLMVDQQRHTNMK